jgi:hypothetical protein
MKPEPTARDPEHPLGPGSAPATGTDDYWATELRPGEEPIVTGTLFMVIILLMIIGAIWVIMYLRLLDR